MHNVLIRRMREGSDSLAEQLGPPPGTKPASTRDERELYWTPDPMVIRDPQGWWDRAMTAAEQAADKDESPNVTMQRASHLAGLAAYPYRAAVIRAGKRALSTQAQIDFVNKMNTLGSPWNESEAEQEPEDG